MMLELKIGGGGKGSQSVFPGSTHTSGEAIEWDQDGALVTVDDDMLLRQVRRLAVAVMLARHWPAEGARHDAALTVGGFLARAGLDEDEAALMLEAIAEAAGDEQEADRVQAARDAVKQYSNGGETRGLPKLVETFGEKVANKAAEWLGYKPQIAANDSHEKLIAKWNERHAHVLAGGKSAVLQEFKTPEGYTDFKLLSSASFHEWNVEHEIDVGVDKNGKPVTMPETKFWMRHPKRRKYQDIGFFPGRDMPDYYNLWRGFAVEPRKGDCSKFLAHVYENVCQGDDALYAWVMAWFADIFQHPAVKCGTSLALRGKQGVGKTKIGEVMESLLGVHYKLVADPRYVTGRFNSHMISLLMLHADEGFWAGDKKAEGKLKDLVTGKSHPIEFKGKEAFWINNYVRLLVTGNQDWQVPAGFEERRFAVLDVGDAHKQDHAYFAAIDAEMDAGGREALLYHLLFEVDCSKVNLRQIPHTTALLEQKLETASPEHGWWLDILRRGVLPGYRDDKDAAERDAVGSALRRLHRARQEAGRVPAGDRNAARHVPAEGRGTGPSPEQEEIPRQKTATDLSVEKRGLVYAFPPLSECRQSFAGLINEEITWEGEDGRTSGTGVDADLWPTCPTASNGGRTREMPVLQGLCPTVRPVRPFLANCYGCDFVADALTPPAGARASAVPIFIIFLSLKREEGKTGRTNRCGTGTFLRPTSLPRSAEKSAGCTNRCGTGVSCVGIGRTSSRPDEGLQDGGLLGRR